VSAEAVRAILDGTTYMTLATADEDGRPWASPVWFATADYREFVWASEPGARHSRNLAARPEVALVVFDSCQRPGTGEGVYVAARAERVPEDDLERCLDVYAAASRAQGLADWRRADVEAPSRHRLYRATAIEHFVLSAGDERVPVAMPPG
jgi:pyridoxine/pyridoxamine 5'-phosphate oxidase